MEIFDLARAKIEQMIEDVTKYTRETYNQSKVLYSTASPFGQLLLVINRLAQMNMSFIEDVATESNINTATRPSSIYGLATLAGHKPMRALAAAGEIYIVYNGSQVDITGDQIIIPNFTKIKCKQNDYTYLLTLGQDELRININQPRKRLFLRVIQGELKRQQHTGTGNELQSFNVTTKITEMVDQFFVNVYVNGGKWKKYDSLYDIPLGTNGYLVHTGITGGLDVVFGNGVYGAMPPLGSTIIVEYLVTNGEQGNINEYRGATFEFNGTGYDIDGAEVDLNSTFNIGINSAITFGVNPEPLYLTRLLAPRTSRSFVLANTDNYVHFFEKFQLFSYINAYTSFDENDPYVDNIIYLLLVPDVKKRMRAGENYFTLPVELFSLSPLEKTRVLQLLEESGQKIVTASVKLIEPQFKRYSLTMDLAVWEGYNKNSIEENIIAKLSDFFLNFRRKDYIPKSDLIAIVEAIDGVDSVKNVTFISEDVEGFLRAIAEGGDETSLAVTNGIDAELKATKTAEGTPLSDVFNLALHEERVQLLAELNTVKTFISKHIDDFGDIVISSNEIPLIRGGWPDRNNTFIADEIASEKHSVVNINFVKTRSKDSREEFSKQTVKRIRDN